MDHDNSENSVVDHVGLFVPEGSSLNGRQVSEWDDLLRFEGLLSSLSAALINVPVCEVDAKIEQGVKTLVDFLGFDRCSVWHFSNNDTRMICSHSVSQDDIKAPPVTLACDDMPMWSDMARQGEIFRIPDVDELPEGHWREKAYCRQMGGIKSLLFIPSQVGGIVVGFITFVSYKYKWTWPDELIQRLRLLWEVISNALERKRADQKMQHALAEIKTLKEGLEAENVFLRDQIDLEYNQEEIIGGSSAIQDALLLVRQVSLTDSTVLILGETGTGKELIARSIHKLSNRSDRAMIKLNCAALPPTLIEAELFGYEKGAFTGAVATQVGRFEAADRSSIFLDEIGELPVELQSKLLRVLQEGQFERVGSHKPIHVNVRVIAATNRDLEKAVREGRFREDLYYRLNVFPISVPPLRERKEDIPLLARAMAQEFGKTFGKKIQRISEQSLEKMKQYPWPGNVRELRNMVERAMILCNSSTLIVQVPERKRQDVGGSVKFDEMARQCIVSALEKTGWRIRGGRGAASILGLHPTTLESKMKKLGISKRCPDGLHEIQ